MEKEAQPLPDEKKEPLHGALVLTLYLLGFRATIMANTMLLMPLDDSSMWFEGLLSGGLNLWLLIAIYRFMHLKATGFGQMIGIMGAIILFNLFASSSANEYSFSEEMGSSGILSTTYLYDAGIMVFFLVAILLLMPLKKNGRNAYDVILNEEKSAEE